MTTDSEAAPEHAGPAARHQGLGEAVVLRSLGDRLAALQKGLSSRTRFIAGLEHGVMSSVAALAAYLPAEALGLRQSFWGAITAIAVVQTEYKATRSTARDQFVGAAIGGGIGVGVVAATGQHVGSYVAAVFIAVLACWTLNVATAARLSGVTATIIMLVPHVGSPERIMLTRVSEVAWGVSVAIAVVWLSGWVGLTGAGGKRREREEVEDVALARSASRATPTQAASDGSSPVPSAGTPLQDEEAAGTPGRSGP